MFLVPLLTKERLGEVFPTMQNYSFQLGRGLPFEYYWQQSFETSQIVNREMLVRRKIIRRKINTN
jgi:hypothetical protein